MARKKEIPHTSSTCGGTGLFITKYNEQMVPYLECSNCGKIIDDWIKWRETYSQYYLDPTRWGQKRDHLMCLLGYFCDLYKQYYSTDFVFSLDDKGLFGGKEVHFIRKVYSQLGGDAQICKSYILWIFTDKVKKKNKRITGLSFLAVPELVQEFTLLNKKRAQITRNKPLPPKMIKWVEENAADVISSVSLRDYGELRMALEAHRSGLLGAIPGMDEFVHRLQVNGVIDSNSNIIGWVND